MFSICLPEKINEIRLSDNSSFWDQGYPALMLTDTSYLRNPNYHQASDTPDTLDYPRMTEVTLGVASAMRRLLGYLSRDAMTYHGIRNIFLKAKTRREARSFRCREGY